MTKDDREKKLTAIEFTRVKLTNPHLSLMIKLNCETNSYLDRRLRPFKFIFPFVVLTELLSTFIRLVQVCLFWRALTINGTLPHHEDQDFKKPNCISTVQAECGLIVHRK